MYNKKEILKTIKLLHKPGTVWEIRAIDAITGTWRKRHNVGGYFNSAENLIEQIDFIKSAVGIYITLNPVNPALLSRINNRLDDAKQNYSTSDQDIIKRDWMLIDLDPKRPANISSTDDELKMSQEVAKNVSLYLQKLNFPIPISAFSGNGSHLLYKIDLPKDDDGLVKRFLEALHNKFSDKLIEIDIKVFNPARITK